MKSYGIPDQPKVKNPGPSKIPHCGEGPGFSGQNKTIFIIVLPALASKMRYVFNTTFKNLGIILRCRQDWHRTLLLKELVKLSEGF
jgi:hypothetical protein